jgi:hypothetical protein
MNNVVHYIVPADLAHRILAVREDLAKGVIKGFPEMVYADNMVRPSVCLSACLLLKSNEPQSWWVLGNMAPSAAWQRGSDAGSMCGTCRKGSLVWYS